MKCLKDASLQTICLKHVVHVSLPPLTYSLFYPHVILPRKQNNPPSVFVPNAFTDPNHPTQTRLTSAFHFRTLTPHCDPIHQRNNSRNFLVRSNSERSQSMESILARALEYTLKYWLKSFTRDQFKLQGRTVQLSNLGHFPLSSFKSQLRLIITIIHLFLNFWIWNFACLDINGDALHSSVGLPPALNVTTAKVGKLEITVCILVHA